MEQREFHQYIVILYYKVDIALSWWWFILALVLLVFLLRNILPLTVKTTVSHEQGQEQEPTVEARTEKPAEQQPRPSSASRLKNSNSKDK